MLIITDVDQISHCKNLVDHHLNGRSFKQKDCYNYEDRPSNEESQWVKPDVVINLILQISTLINCAKSFAIIDFV